MLDIDECCQHSSMSNTHQCPKLINVKHTSMYHTPQQCPTLINVQHSSMPTLFIVQHSQSAMSNTHQCPTFINAYTLQCPTPRNVQHSSMCNTHQCPILINVQHSTMFYTHPNVQHSSMSRAEVIMLIIPCIILFRISCNFSALCSKFHALFSRLFPKSLSKQCSNY